LLLLFQYTDNFKYTQPVAVKPIFKHNALHEGYCNLMTDETV
jgi:hypothetical protein